MISTMRKKFGPIIIGIIVGFIAFVFIFEFGMDRSSGRSGGMGYAGSVNGEPITTAEFNREFNRRMEFFKALSGGQLNEEMIKQYRIKESVFRDLATKKIMIQEAEKVGLLPSNAQVREQIVEIPAFQKDGKFDRQHYKTVLQSNSYTPASFEKMIRDDLISQLWRDHFKNLARFSEEEIKREYLMSHDKRQIRYVMLTFESGRKRLKISGDEVEKYLKDTAKQNLAKSRYDERKASIYKTRTFDQVKHEIARELVGEEKTAEIRKLNEELGGKVEKALTASPASDGAVNALLKESELKVQTSRLMARGSFFLDGAGDAKAIEQDAFSGNLTKAKKYNVAGGVAVAVVTKAETGDLANLNDAEREQMITKIVQRKENDLYSAWMKGLVDRSKIVQNAEAGGADAGT